MFSCKTVPQSFEFLGGVFATQTQEGQICYVEGRAGCRNVSVAAHGAGQGGSVGNLIKGVELFEMWLQMKTSPRGPLEIFIGYPRKKLE